MVLGRQGPGTAGAALKGLCPRCGAAGLFEEIAAIAPRCGACGLDFSAYEQGRRPGGLLTLLAAAALIGLALAVDAALRPPVWVYVLIWGPLTAAAVVAAVRYAKAMRIVRAYQAEAQGAE